jgi:hypothetical protein
MNWMEIEQLKSKLKEWWVDVGKVRISRINPEKRGGDDRYVIYLPKNRNYLWEELHGVSACVLIEIPADIAAEIGIIRSPINPPVGKISLDCGMLKITRKNDERYALNLSKNRNYVWRKLYKKKVACVVWLGIIS